jgi:hypothetical protein
MPGDDTAARLRAVRQAAYAVLPPEEIIDVRLLSEDGEPRVRVTLAHLQSDEWPFRLADIAGNSPIDFAFRVFNEFQDHVSETAYYWGQALPACPGHSHAVTLERDGDRLLLVCPHDREAPIRELDLTAPSG